MLQKVSDSAQCIQYCRDINIPLIVPGIAAAAIHTDWIAV